MISKKILSAALPAVLAIVMVPALATSTCVGPDCPGPLPEPELPQDSGTVSQTPIPPGMIAHAEPYRTGVIAFMIDDGTLTCAGDTDTYNADLYRPIYSNDSDKHIFLHDDGNHNDVHEAFLDTTHRDAFITMHGGEIQDMDTPDDTSDDRYHVKAILEAKGSSPFCGEKLEVISISGNCDGSTIRITSDNSRFVVAAAGDNVHAACIP